VLQDLKLPQMPRDRGDSGFFLGFFRFGAEEKEGGDLKSAKGQN
jgi:hypothetical protein